MALLVLVAVWVPALQPADDVDRRIALLGADAWEDRERATRELIRADAVIEPRLVRALAAAEDVETRARLNYILDKRRDLVRAGAVLLVIGVGPTGLASAEWSMVGAPGGLDPPRLLEHVVTWDPATGRWSADGRPHEPNRIASLGVRDATEWFACLLWAPEGILFDRRPASRFEPLAPVVVADIARPFDLDPPAVFELLRRVRGFDFAVPALQERLRTARDPLVRSVCERALETQLRGDDPCSD